MEGRSLALPQEAIGVRSRPSPQITKPLLGEGFVD
jgi:hypothetical protein